MCAGLGVGEGTAHSGKYSHFVVFHIETSVFHSETLATYHKGLEMGEREGGVRRRIGRPAPAKTEPCDRCGYGTFKLACKEVCPNCGARRDCSDLGKAVYSGRAA